MDAGDPPPGHAVEVADQRCLRHRLQVGERVTRGLADQAGDVEPVGRGVRVGTDPVTE